SRLQSMGASRPAIESSAESLCHRFSIDRNKTHLLRPRARSRQAYLRIRKSPRNARKTSKPYLRTQVASERVPALLRAWLDNKSPSMRSRLPAADIHQSEEVWSGRKHQYYPIRENHRKKCCCLRYPCG